MRKLCTISQKVYSVILTTPDVDVTPVFSVKKVLAEESFKRDHRVPVFVEFDVVIICEFDVAAPLDRTIDLSKDLTLSLPISINPGVL